MSEPYPHPEVWPDDDPELEPTRDEQARSELDPQEHADYIQKKGRKW